MALAGQRGRPFGMAVGRAKDIISNLGVGNLEPDLRSQLWVKRVGLSAHQ
jgi:hypothetical protein